MEYSTWAMLLLFVGLLMLVAEVFIPSGGAISVIAGVSLLAAIVCAFNAWWPQSRGLFWTYLASMAMLLPLVVAVAFYFWPSTPIGKRAILEAPAPEEIEPFVELQEKFARMVGRIGETVTLLNPAGIVKIDGERIHCQSEGMILEPGTPARIIAVQGNRVVVRKCSIEEQLAQQQLRRAQDAEASGPVDFELS